jgi:pimeloyl-ACP methyl ester carboxylesterase
VRLNDKLVVAEPVEDASRLPATTFIRGGLSDYVDPEAHRDAINRFFPGATIHTVEAAGHFVHAEKPKEFVEAAVSALLRR